MITKEEALGDPDREFDCGGSYGQYYSDYRIEEAMDTYMEAHLEAFYGWWLTRGSIYSSFPTAYEAYKAYLFVESRREKQQ